MLSCCTTGLLVGACVERESGVLTRGNMFCQSRVLMIKRSAGNDQECGRFQELLGAPFVALEQEVASLKGLLGPGEQLLVRGVDKRRSEFTAGRLLARRAFGCFGLEHAELLADPDGVPQWPAGSVGCITHAGGRVAVAVAPRESAEGVGIDMETVARFHG